MQNWSEFSNKAQSILKCHISFLTQSIFITPPSEARGGLKEIGQNPDSGSKNSKNQNNDAVL